MERPRGVSPENPVLFRVHLVVKVIPIVALVKFCAVHKARYRFGNFRRICNRSRRGDHLRAVFVHADGQLVERICMGKHAEIFIQRVLIEIQPEIVRLKIGADRRLRIIPAVKQKTCQIGPHRFFGERIVVFLITRPDGSFGNTCFNGPPPLLLGGQLRLLHRLLLVLRLVGRRLFRLRLIFLLRLLRRNRLRLVLRFLLRLLLRLSLLGVRHRCFGFLSYSRQAW